MVSGHLQEKNGLYHMVLNLKDENGKRVTKWFATGLPIKGNKKKAEEMLLETRQSHDAPKSLEKSELLFTVYMRQWLEGMKPNIEVSTYTAYDNAVDRICVYFSDKNILLKDLESKDIQDFYTYSLTERKVSANTVIHYHANIRKALQYAVKMKLIPTNPALNVDRPRKHKYTGCFYDVESINQLLEVVKGTRIELAVMLASFYGLRRSEAVGLKWDAIDFKNKTITISHTVLETTVDGKLQMIAKDRAKTKSSMRSLPLVEDFEKYLLDLRERQKEYKRVCGNCYNYDYDGYVYVDEMGNLIRPGFITQNFQIVLKAHNLKVIRYHDLRHSCASLLLANGVSLKEIQDWLGHSTFATTADIYAHLDKSTKVSTVNAMLSSGIKVNGSRNNEPVEPTSTKEKNRVTSGLSPKHVLI